MVLSAGGAAYGLSAISGGKKVIAVRTEVLSKVDYSYEGDIKFKSNSKDCKDIPIWNVK
ncbi:hypothetical protein [Streptobacillus moniliformis]|uniref:hypothetical protein n=1 Tax=Streptobacillus moniliformis TaxID=34105 RepID=UPI000A7F1748|nr:hypothetical protein [Streptobacillus moniliformis]